MQNTRLNSAKSKGSNCVQLRLSGFAEQTKDTLVLITDSLYDQGISIGIEVPWYDAESVIIAISKIVPQKIR